MTTTKILSVAVMRRNGSELRVDGLNYFEYGMRIYEKNNVKTSLRWNNINSVGCDWREGVTGPMEVDGCLPYGFASVDPFVCKIKWIEILVQLDTASFSASLYN